MPEKTYFNLDNPQDKKEVLEFEKALKAYKGTSQVVFKTILKGFDLLLFKNGFFVFNDKYPTGALVFRKLPEYRTILAKMSAYKSLCGIREEQEKSKLIENYF